MIRLRIFPLSLRIFAKTVLAASLMIAGNASMAAVEDPQLIFEAALKERLSWIYPRKPPS